MTCRYAWPVAAPTLRHIKTFQVAARYCSFKRAAEELHVTAAAVSHQMKALEAQLGVGLFARRANALQLTDAGRHYLASIDALFTRLELATDQVRRRFHRPAVRLSVPPFFASELLLPRLGAFSAVHADIDLHLNARPNSDGEPPAAADISVICGRGHWPGAICHRLFPLRVVAACAPRPAGARRIAHVRDLADETLIVDTRHPDMWHRWALLLGEADLRPRQEIRLDSMSVAAHAAELGVGVALVSAPVAQRRFAAGTLQRVFEAELVTGDAYYVLARPDDAARPAVRTLVEWLLHEFQPGPASPSHN